MSALRIFISFILCLFVLIGNAAERLYKHSTTFETSSDCAKGCGLRDEYGTALKLFKSGDAKSAEEHIESALKKYEQLFNKKIKQFTFQSTEEVAEFRTQNKTKFEWIDWGYKECLQLKAFLLSEAKQFDKSLEVLNTIDQVAPISAATRLERGYILNQLKLSDRAFQAYDSALKVSLKYKSQKPFQAAALRGLGSALIDLERLDEAESMFNQSLNIEPGNRIAESELNYIKKLRFAK